MNEGHSGHAEDIFGDALDVEPAARPAFLEQACAGDPTLRSEVETLLAADAAAGSFIRQPIVRRDVARVEQGETLAGRFRIISFIDRGGMGDVYEAQDLELRERVALKTIRADIGADPRALGRFKKEIQLAKRISHPNVCRIHDLGIHQSASGNVVFLTMEFLSGHTLADRLAREPMGVSEAARIATQMAAALDAAHACGIIHRDLKSANVMLVDEGTRKRVVVMDFGLAKTMSRNGADTSFTATGTILGTPDYMAPEQVLGEPAGPAADIYAFGLILFEMVTGKRPFQAETPMAAAIKRLNAPPPSPRSIAPELPQVWETVILRCLERNPAARFAHAGDAIEALELGSASGSSAHWLKSRRRLLGLAAAAVAIIASILAATWIVPLLFKGPSAQSLAILPFANADTNTDYVSDGVTEDLINSLGQIRNLTVIARSSVAPYKGKTQDPAEIGRKLGVRAVLTGRIVANGDDLTVSVELVDARENRHLWGDRYRRKLSEVNAIKEDVAQETVRRLGLGLTSEDRHLLTKRHTKNALAYELYNKGRFFWNKRTQEGFRRAIEFYKQAIDADSQYALAYTGLADCYAMQSGLVAPRESFPKAEQAALKALALDDSLAEAHASLAFIRLFYSWDWLDTEKEYTQAIRLNPNYANAHSMYAIYLTVMSRFDQALAEAHRAQELDPLSAAVATGVGRVHFYAGQYRLAIAQFRTILDIYPQFAQAHMSLGIALQESGDPAGAAGEIQKALGVTPTIDAGGLSDLGYVYAKAGRRKEALDIIARLNDLSGKRYVSPYFRAVVHEAVGERDQAISLLQQGLEDRTFSMIYLKLDPRFVSLRADPQWRDLVRRIGM